MNFNDTLAVAATKVYVFGADPLSRAGVSAYLRGRTEVELVPQAAVDDADVALIVADEVDQATLAALRSVQGSGCPRVVLLVSEVDARGVSAAVQAGAVGVLRRSAATRDGLLSAVRAAAVGEGVFPPDLLGGLLRQAPVPVPVALPPRRVANGLTRPSDREVNVLRLLSEGCDTREIARKLSYSERTVKNVIQDVTRRFGLRNRSHAVAYALRHGYI